MANMAEYLAALKQIEIAQTFEALHEAEEKALAWRWRIIKRGEDE